MTQAESARFPADSLIAKQALVEDGAVLGARCRIGPGAYLGHGVRLGEGVEVGPNATLETPQASTIVVGDGVRIGANATLAPGTVVSAGAWVKPGAVVTRDVPPGAIVEGNPAAMIGHVGATEGPRAQARSTTTLAPADWIQATPVRGVAIYNFPVITDMRGDLTVGEFDKQIPFRPLRYFMVFDVPSREIRGEHAHHTCHEFLVCVRGSCSVAADDGRNRVEVLLDSPSRGIYLPPMTWRIHYKYSPDAILLVFASHHYDTADYIRDYADFCRLVET